MPLPESFLDRYRVESRIAAGAHGTVFAAIDERSGREVAVKIFDGGECARDNHGAWVDELRLAARLRHPNIAACLDVGEDKASGAQVLVYARARGGSLRRTLVAGPPLARADVIVLLREITAALAHAHRHQVIHRDVKPENILAMEAPGRGPWALTDFGAGRFLAAGATARTLAGSRSYMAPEVLLRQATPASDQYSLGMVGLEALTGATPSNAARSQFLARRREVGHLEAVIARMLDPDPLRRFFDMDSVARALAGPEPVDFDHTRLGDGRRLAVEGDLIRIEGDDAGAILGRLGRARRFVNLEGEASALCCSDRRLVAIDGGLTTVLAGDRALDVLAASVEIGVAWVREADELRLERLPFGGSIARGQLPEALMGALAGASRVLGAVLSSSVAVFGWPFGQVLLRAREVDGRLRISPIRLEAPLYRLSRVGSDVVALCGDDASAHLEILTREGEVRRAASAALAVDAVTPVAGVDGPLLTALIPSFVEVVGEGSHSARARA